MVEFFSFKMFTHKIVPEPVPSMCVLQSIAFIRKSPLTMMLRFSFLHLTQIIELGSASCTLTQRIELGSINQF